LFGIEPPESPSATRSVTHQRNSRGATPLRHVSVWNDIRTDSTVDVILAKVPENNKNYFKPLCGLPISPYFSAFKLKWLMHHVPEVKKAIKAKKCLFGTVDTWILWV
jgi:glycerol kinase